MTMSLFSRTITGMIAMMVAGHVVAQVSLDDFKEKCAAYGYAEGTSAFAACVQKQDEAHASRTCSAIAERGKYFCNGGDSDTLGPAYSAQQCTQAQQAYVVQCQ